MACLHAGDSSPRRCYGSGRLRPALSPRCQAPTSQVENQAHTRTESGCRAAPLRSFCPSGHGCHLRPTAQMRGRGGRKEGRAPDHGMQEYRNKLGKEGYLHAYRQHEDRDEVMAGTRLEVRPQDALLSLQRRWSQHLVPREPRSGKRPQKARLLPASFRVDSRVQYPDGRGRRKIGSRWGREGEQTVQSRDLWQQPLPLSAEPDAAEGTGHIQEEPRQTARDRHC